MVLLVASSPICCSLLRTLDTPPKESPAGTTQPADINSCGLLNEEARVP